MIRLNLDAKTPKYKQIVTAVIDAIERGELKHHDQLPSINELSQEYYLARDTVDKAYATLKSLKIIDSVRGKGFFIAHEKPKQLRVLLVMNKLSAYKKMIYDSFVATLADTAQVSLYVHHGNARIFEDIVKKNKEHFHYYVIMPHFYEATNHVNVVAILQQIPLENLIILDKQIPELTGKYAAVFQDFNADIYESLCAGIDLIEKYEELVIVFPKDVKYPQEILQGFRNFCVHYNKKGRVIDKANNEVNIASKAYIVLEDADLAELVRQTRHQQLELGKDIGIISFNDTPLKEVLAEGITVISTDHAQMGITAANLLLEKKTIKVKNPFSLIRRKSL